MSVTTQRQMILWTFVLAVTFGVAIAMLMLQAPTPEAQLETSPKFARLQKFKEKKRQRLALLEAKANPKGKIALASLEKREPASTEESPPAIPSSQYTVPQVSELNLACNGEQKSEFNKDIAQVRLTGNACTSRREIASTEIRNDSNGSSATVFFPTATSFMTDYLVLSPGENRIRILHVFKSGGKEEREYLIERASPARR